MYKLFCLMGKSASGKDSIYKALIQDETLHLKTVVSYTTRPVREGETEGVEYHFTNQQELLNLKKEGKVIECRDYDTVYGIWSYFLADDGQIDLEKQNAIVIGTLESYEKIREYFGEEAVVPIYIEVEDGLRLSRALDRERQQKTPKYAELCRRFLADSEDFSEEKLKNNNIHRRFQNEDFNTCLLEIKTAFF